MAQRRLSLWSCSCNCWLPKTIVKIYVLPTVNLAICVVDFPHTKVITQQWRSVPNKTLVSFHLLNATVGVPDIQATRHFGSATKGCLFKIPNKTTKCVLHTVAKLKCQNVCAILELSCYVVAIVVQNVVRI